jgi:hypothetical protein
MPGEISRASSGSSNEAPYVPSWCYPQNGPKMCPCGHHEGYHADDGTCLHSHKCGCVGLPADCRTDDAEQSVRRTGLCPECGSEVVVCMMGHYCGEKRPAAKASR